MWGERCPPVSRTFTNRQIRRRSRSTGGRFWSLRPKLIISTVCVTHSFTSPTGGTWSACWRHLAAKVAGHAAAPSLPWGAVHFLFNFKKTQNVPYPKLSPGGHVRVIRRVTWLIPVPRYSNCHLPADEKNVRATENSGQQLASVVRVFQLGHHPPTWPEHSGRNHPPHCH